jgi:hypothetical protein
MGATAKETERVLKLHEPSPRRAVKQEGVLAIGQISVMPGWRTRQDYICEVSARFHVCSKCRN